MVLFLLLGNRAFTWSWMIFRGDVTTIFINHFAATSK